MKIKKISKNSLKNIIGFSLILIVYWSFFYYFGANDMVAKLLAPGKHLSFFIIISASLFVVLRFFIIVILPGIVLAMAGIKIFDRLRLKKRL